MRGIVGASVVSLLAGCGGQPTTPAPSAGERADGQAAAEPTRSARDAAKAFLALQAADASNAIGWKHLLRSRALFVMGLPEAAPMRAQMVQTLKDTDIAPLGAEERRAFEGEWTPKHGCSLSESQTPPLPGAALSQLPDPYVKTAGVLRSAQFFTARCEGDRTYRIGVASSGTIIAFDDEMPVDLDADNRFIEYMNQPDEPVPPR